MSIGPRTPVGSSPAERPWRIDRLSSERDLDGLLEVAHASFSNPWTREMFVWELQHSDVSHVYVARLPAERIVGFCCCWLVFDELHINNLAVHPEWRGRGLALGLMEHVLRQERERGARRVMLEVRRSNEPALGLYRKLGFEVVGERRAYYTNPEEDALVLGRDAAG